MSNPLESWYEEQRSVYLYRACAEAEAGTTRAELFRRLAGEAEAQAAIWRAHHPGARGRGARAGPPGRGGEAPQRGRDAGVDRRDLHRQDRDADREPDASHPDLGRRPGAEPGKPSFRCSFAGYRGAKEQRKRLWGRWRRRWPPATTPASATMESRPGTPPSWRCCEPRGGSEPKPTARPRDGCGNFTSTRC